MSKRCELQKEYFKQYGNYKGVGKYSDDYVKWLEDKIIPKESEVKACENNIDICFCIEDIETGIYESIHLDRQKAEKEKNKPLTLPYKGNKENQLT